MTVTEQVLALAMLEEDGEPKIPGLRIYVKRVPGQDWLPVDPKDAAWALMEYSQSFLINKFGAWFWLDSTGNGWYRMCENPWESLIAAAYAAETNNGA